LAPFGNLSVTGLPDGVTASLSGSTITLSGTPTTFGTFSLGVAVNDTTGAVASAGFTFTVNTVPAPGALTSNQWEVGQPGYPGSIPISGGTGSFTVVDQSDLPPGLGAAVAGTNAVFPGTPTSAGPFAGGLVTVQDATGATATATFTITINAAPTLGALSSSAWTVNQSGFSSSITVSGGTSPFSGLTVANLPAGLTALLHGSTITVSGTPTPPRTYGNPGISAPGPARAAARAT